jgi:hypothetical protein
VIALFAKLGTVEHKSNNEFVFAIDGEHHLMRKAHGKHLPVDDVVEFWMPRSSIAPPDSNYGSSKLRIRRQSARERAG